MDNTAIFENVSDQLLVAAGIKINELCVDHAEMELEVKPGMINPHGQLHGGIYFIIADCAAGYCAHADGNKYVTLNADVHFMKPTNHGVIKAVARIMHRGRTTCVLHVQVSGEDGTVLLESTFTMYRIPEQYE